MYIAPEIATLWIEAEIESSEVGLHQIANFHKIEYIFLDLRL